MYSDSTKGVGNKVENGINGRGQHNSEKGPDLSSGENLLFEVRPLPLHANLFWWFTSHSFFRFIENKSIKQGERIPCFGEKEIAAMIVL
jgi:hypothetical protein